MLAFSRKLTSATGEGKEWREKDSFRTKAAQINIHTVDDIVLKTELRLRLRIKRGSRTHHVFYHFDSGSFRAGHATPENHSL